MNGFGQDPFRLYSFQAPDMTAMQGLASPQQAQNAVSRLQSSLGYRQAGREGRQRMETLVGMGLPAQTDINKVRLERAGREGRAYSAPRPLPFGSYSGFGPTEEDRPVAPRVPVGGPQPAQGVSVPPIVPERSLGMTAESPLAFTGFGRTIGESAYRTSTVPQTVPSPIPSGTTRTMTSFGGVPRFPFAGY